MISLPKICCRYILTHVSNQHQKSTHAYKIEHGDYQLKTVASEPGPLFLIVFRLTSIKLYGMIK